MPKLGGLKYWGRAAGHMTLLKISQGMTSNPCLIEGVEDGSSLPTAGLGCGGNPGLAHRHKDISQGKPLAQ